MTTQPHTQHMRSIAKSPFSHKDGEKVARLARRMSAATAAAMLALAALILAAPPIASARCAPDRAIDDRMYAIAGALYGVDPALLKAIAYVESCGAPDAVSTKGAQGLMQLMPSTAADYDVADPFDPVENLLGAARFLRDLQGPQGSAVPEILAAYNAGPLAVARFGGIPPYPETREYVRRVLYQYLREDRESPRRPAARHQMRSSAPAKALHGPALDSHWLSQIEAIRTNRGEGSGGERR